jgi:hypothetical protein
MGTYRVTVQVEVELEAYGESDASEIADDIYKQINEDGWMVCDFCVTDLELNELYCSQCAIDLDPDKYDDTPDVLCQQCEEEQDNEEEE